MAASEAACNLGVRPRWVALFVRVPVPGLVKTRLAAALGDQGACQLYEAMVADILTQLRRCPFPLFLFHDGHENAPLPPAWRAAASRVSPQQGEGLGERMAAAFASCFAQGFGRVILAGSDIPGLEAGVLIQTAAALAEADGVLVPVVDGGYCLIGLKATTALHQLFADIPWSTDQVLEKTRQGFARAKLSLALLPPLADIDTVEDLRTYCRNPCGSATATNRAILPWLAPTLEGKKQEIRALG